jgi:hypothetical protein
MSQEILGTMSFSTVVASHSHPVSTGWSNDAVQPGKEQQVSTLSPVSTGTGVWTFNKQNIC